MKNRGEVDVFSLFCAVLVFSLLGIFAVSVIREIHSPSPYFRNVGTFNIKSIKTTDKNYTASFFLGSGSFEGRTYFYSYVEIQPGIYQLKRYDSRHVTISERNEKPTVTINEVAKGPENGTEYAAFVVPPGTIIEQFKLE